MKNKEIISIVRNTLKEHNKDSVLPTKLIYKRIRTVTNMLIKREYDSKNVIFNQTTFWSTYYADMIKVPTINIPGLSTNCEIWRSKVKLPEFIESNTGFINKSLTSIDNSVSFNLSTPQTIVVKNKLKFNKEKYVWIEDRYLYSLNAYAKLKIIGLFEQDLNSNNCSRLEDTFKCPIYLEEAVIQMTLQSFGVFKQIPNDNNTNKNSNN